MTSKRHFEINWPLILNFSQESISIILYSPLGNSTSHNIIACRLFCGFLFQCKMQNFGDELFSQRLRFHALFTRWIRNCKFCSKLSICANSSTYLCFNFHYKMLRNIVHTSTESILIWRFNWIFMLVKFRFMEWLSHTRYLNFAPIQQSFRDIHIECSKQFKWNSYFYVSGQIRPFWAALKLL